MKLNNALKKIMNPFVPSIPLQLWGGKKVRKTRLKNVTGSTFSTQLTPHLIVTTLYLVRLLAKPFDGGALVLELPGMWSTPSLTLLPGSL